MYTQKCISCKHVEPLLNFFHGLYLLNMEKSHFYHNGAIFRVLIGRELCSIRRYRPWKWCDGGAICFFLSLVRDFRENSTEMDVKTVNVMVKKKNRCRNVEMLLSSQLFGQTCTRYPPLPPRELACSPGRVEESLLFLLTCWLPLGLQGGGLYVMYIFLHIYVILMNVSTVLSPYAFSICDTSGPEYKDYEYGGIGRQIKTSSSLLNFVS